MVQESVTSKTIRSTYWTTIEKIFSMGVSFVVSMVLARLLTPSDFGTVALMTVFFAIANSIATCGFANALIRKDECSQADYSTAFYYNVLVAILLYIIIYFAAPFIADFYDVEILSSVIRISGLTIIINSINLTQSVQLTRNLRFKSLSIRTVMSAIASGITGIIAAYYGLGVWALVIQSLTNSIVGSILLIVAVRWVPSLAFSKDSFRYLWNFGSKMLVTGIISTLYSNIYSIVIGKAFDNYSLGLFNRGQHISGLCPSIVDGIFTKTTLPILSQLQSDRERLLAVYRKMVVMVSSLTFPLCLLMCALARPFVLFFLTEKWSDAIIYIQIFSITCITSSANIINLNLFQVEGRSDITLKIEIIKKAVGFAMVFSLLIYGPMVLAIGCSCFNIFAYSVNLFFVHKLEKIPYSQQLLDLFPCSFASVIAAIFAFIVSLSPVPYWAQFLGGGIVGIIVYYLFTRYYFKFDIYTIINEQITKKFHGK